MKGTRIALKLVVFNILNDLSCTKLFRNILLFKFFFCDPTWPWNVNTLIFSNETKSNKIYVSSIFNKECF